ncbi:hypothetical protein [Archangium violaceum]|nr:hypothetical protein [Archangium violaceum]
MMLKLDIVTARSVRSVWVRADGGLEARVVPVAPEVLVGQRDASTGAV